MATATPKIVFTALQDTLLYRFTDPRLRGIWEFEPNVLLNGGTYEFYPETGWLTQNGATIAVAHHVERGDITHIDWTEATYCDGPHEPPNCRNCVDIDGCPVGENRLGVSPLKRLLVAYPRFEALDRQGQLDLIAAAQLSEADCERFERDVAALKDSGAPLTFRTGASKVLRGSWESEHPCVQNIPKEDKEALDAVIVEANREVPAAKSKWESYADTLLRERTDAPDSSR